MAHYAASIETPRPPAETFAYLSDFSTTEEWDPGVVEAERLGDAPVGEGTEFRLVADFLGRKTALTYRIVEFEPDQAVTLRGENTTVVSLDRITCEPSDGGTRVTYDADLSLKGPLRIADPLLGLAFERVGDRALAGARPASAAAAQISSRARGSASEAPSPSSRAGATCTRVESAATQGTAEESRRPSLERWLRVMHRLANAPHA